MGAADVLLVLHRVLDARASLVDAYSDGHGHVHAFAYSDSHVHDHAFAYSDGHVHAFAYSDGHGHVHAFAYSDGHASASTHSHASAPTHSAAYCDAPADGYCGSNSYSPSAASPSAASPSDREDLLVGVDRPDPDVAAGAGAVGVDCSLRQWIHRIPPSGGPGRGAVSDCGIEGGPRGAPLDSPATGGNARCA